MSTDSSPSWEQRPELRPVGTVAAPSGPPATAPSGPLRLALIDSETAFTQVAIKRAEALEWRHRTFTSAPPVEELAAMRAGAIIIDLELCGPDRWDYLAALAGGMPDAALVVATARSTLAQRVRGLRLGADDWITKPSHPEEVLARVQAIVRRRAGAASARAPEPSVHGELQIRPDRFDAYVGGAAIGLTRREFELLELLAGNPERVLERDEVYRRVWGYEMPRGDRSVDVFVRKLRKKLESASPGWHYIHTHFGIGYRFEVEPSGGEDDPKPPS